MLVEKHSGGGVVIVLVLYNIYSMRLVYMMLQRARLGALSSCWGLQGGKRGEEERGPSFIEAAPCWTLLCTISMLLTPCYYVVSVSSTRYSIFIRCLEEWRRKKDSGASQAKIPLCLLLYIQQHFSPLVIIAFSNL